MAKYEYRCVNYKPIREGVSGGPPAIDETAIAAHLSQLANDGWELINAVFVPAGGSRLGPTTDALLHYLRREVTG
jgi:hypothetical protein